MFPMYCRKWARSSLAWWLRHVGQTLDVDLYLLGPPAPTPPQAAPAPPPAALQPPAVQPAPLHPAAPRPAPLQPTDQLLNSIAETSDSAAMRPEGDETADHTESPGHILQASSYRSAYIEQQQQPWPQSHDAPADDGADPVTASSSTQAQQPRTGQLHDLQAAADCSLASSSSSSSDATKTKYDAVALGHSRSRLQYLQPADSPEAFSDLQAPTDSQTSDIQAEPVKHQMHLQGLSVQASSPTESGTHQQSQLLSRNPGPLLSVSDMSNAGRQAAASPLQGTDSDGHWQRLHQQADGQQHLLGPDSAVQGDEESATSVQRQAQANADASAGAHQDGVIGQEQPQAQQDMQEGTNNATAAGLAVNSQQAAYDEGQLTGPLLALGALLVLTMLLMNTAALTVPCLLGKWCDHVGDHVVKRAASFAV